MTEGDLDARLSAWLDGEVSEEEARALAERVANDPQVAARVRVLASVDDALRSLPGPTPGVDLRARLDDRIAARGARAVVPLRPLRWAIPAAAALAAGIAIYLGVRTSTHEGVIPRAPVAPEPPFAREEPSVPRDEVEEDAIRVAEDSDVEPIVEPVIEPNRDSDSEPEDAELALALDYDLLRDFDVIDQLELLEVLAAYEEDRGGRS